MLLMSFHCLIDTGTGELYEVDNLGGYTAAADMVFNAALAPFGTSIDKLNGQLAAHMEPDIRAAALNIMADPDVYVSLLPPEAFVSVKEAGKWLLDVADHLLRPHPACIVEVRYANS